MQKSNQVTCCGVGAIELPDSVYLAPVVADNSLYFLTEGGKLVVLR